MKKRNCDKMEEYYNKILDILGKIYTLSYDKEFRFKDEYRYLKNIKQEIEDYLDASIENELYK